MKINVLLMAALGAFILASCSNENGIPADRKERTAFLNVRITSPEAKASTPTTGFGTTAPSEEEVKNFKVFILDQNDEIEWRDYSSNGEKLIDIPVTTNAKYVFVIANAGNIDFTSKAALDAYAADLNVTGSGRQTTDRWATGISPELVFTQTGTDFKAEATVPLTFVAARITLTIESNMGSRYDATKTDGSLVLTDVAVLNARRESRLHGDPGSLLVTPAKYCSGINPETQFSYWPHYANITVSGMMTDKIASNDFSTTYYYYVFENDAVKAEAFPTIITLIGTFDGKTVYYPVHLAPYEKWGGSITTTVSGIQRGKSYDINVKLSVDPTIEGGDADGTDDPTQPVVSAKVDVTIEEATWTAVPLEKEF